jgi:hypothetical protein
MNHRRLLSILFALVLLGLASSAYGGAARGSRPDAGKWTYSPALLWEVRAPGGDTLRVPAEVRIASDGGVVFRDFGRDISYILDEDGRLVTAFARGGEERGEVPRYLNCFTSDGEIAIASPSGLHFYSNNGKFLRSYPNDAFARFPLAFVGPDRFLCAPGELTADESGRAEILEVDLSEGEEHVFASIDAAGAPQASGGPSLLISGLTPTVELARDARTGTIYFGRNDLYQIHAVDSKGREVTSFGLDTKRIAIDEAGKRAHFEGVDIPEEALAQIIDGLPSELTCFRRLQVIGDLLFATATGTIGRAPHEVTQDIFTLNGDYLYRGRISLPGRATISGSEDNLILGDGFFVAVLAYPDGSRSIARYEVRMPPAR